MNLVPATAIIVIGIVAGVTVALTGDSEVAKIAIGSIGGMVTGGTMGYVAGRKKRDKVDKAKT